MVFAKPTLANLTQQWLLRAAEWGATPSPTAHDVLAKLMDGIYFKSRWTYTPGSKDGDGARLIGGTLKTGNCDSFTEAWMNLARVHGIPVGAASLGDQSGLGSDKFLTITGLRLIGSTETGNAAGPNGNRWVFGHHRWGFYDNRNYDLLFNRTWDGTTASLFEPLTLKKQSSTAWVGSDGRRRITTTQVAPGTSTTLPRYNYTISYTTAAVSRAAALDAVLDEAVEAVSWLDETVAAARASSAAQTARFPASVAFAETADWRPDAV